MVLRCSPGACWTLDVAASTRTGRFFAFVGSDMVRLQCVPRQGDVPIKIHKQICGKMWKQKTIQACILKVFQGFQGNIYLSIQATYPVKAHGVWTPS